MIDEDVLRRLAKISRIKLGEEESIKIREELISILDNFKILNEADTENIEPSFQPFEIKNIIREDEEGECLSQEETLKNAEQTKDKFFKGPRAV